MPFLKLNKDHSTEFAGYISYNYKDTRLIIDPSIRIQNYTSLGETSIEPRLGVKYNLNEYNLTLKQKEDRSINGKIY